MRGDVDRSLTLRLLVALSKLTDGPAYDRENSPSRPVLAFEGSEIVPLSPVRQSANTHDNFPPVQRDPRRCRTSRSAPDWFVIGTRNAFSRLGIHEAHWFTPCSGSTFVHHSDARRCGSHPKEFFATHLGCSWLYCVFGGEWQDRLYPCPSHVINS